MKKADKAIVDQWKKKIATTPKWALRAAVVIYGNQTSNEQGTHATLESNGVGFTSFDSPVLSPIVDKYLRGINLTGKEKYQLQRRMPKYAAQLYRKVQEDDTRDDRRGSSTSK